MEDCQPLGFPLLGWRGLEGETLAIRRRRATSKDASEIASYWCVRQVREHHLGWAASGSSVLPKNDPNAFFGWPWWLATRAAQPQEGRVRRDPMNRPGLKPEARSAGVKPSRGVKPFLSLRDPGCKPPRPPREAGTLTATRPRRMSKDLPDAPLTAPGRLWRLACCLPSCRASCAQPRVRPRRPRAPSGTARPHSG